MWEWLRLKTVGLTSILDRRQFFNFQLLFPRHANVILALQQQQQRAVLLL